jgi:hypothetical protein
MGRIKRLKRTLCLPVDLKEITSGFWPLTLRRHFPIVFFCVPFCVLCRHFHFVFCHVTLLLSEKGWLWVEVLSSESPLSALARIGKVLSRPWPQTKCGILHYASRCFERAANDGETRRNARRENKEKAPTLAAGAPSIAPPDAFPRGRHRDGNPWAAMKFQRFCRCEARREAQNW